MGARRGSEPPRRPYLFNDCGQSSIGGTIHRPSALTPAPEVGTALVPTVRPSYAARCMSPRRVLVLVTLGLALIGIALPAAAVDPAADPATAETQVLSDADGAYAQRTRGPDGQWQLPDGDAVLIDEAWWTPLRPLADVTVPNVAPDAATLERIRDGVAPAATRRLPDRLTATTLGDVTLDGEPDLVISFRRPFQRTFINITRPRRAWADDHGLSAHVGLYRPDDLSQIWVAGTLTRPVVDLAACDGALAVAYGRLRQPGTIETGAWRWVVFGFLPVEPLPGAGTPTCVDIDGDGRTEPAITERSAP
jgi:hypothetical protein